MERSYSLRGIVPALAQKLHGTTKPAAAPSLSPFKQDGRKPVLLPTRQVSSRFDELPHYHRASCPAAATFNFLH